MVDSEPLVSQLAQAVVAMDAQRVAELAHEIVARGLSVGQAINQGLAAGMRRVGEMYAAKEYFVPQVLAASKAMYAGFDILRERLASSGSKRGRIALGVVQGDIHDIGKNIVKVMVEAAGFEVIDLGRDVPATAFVRAAQDGAQVIGLSSLMTTTMPKMGKVIEALERSGLREKVRVIVGGAPVTADFARRIGADSFAADAHGAVLAIERLIFQK